MSARAELELMGQLHGDDRDALNVKTEYRYTATAARWLRPLAIEALKQGKCTDEVVGWLMMVETHLAKLAGQQH